MAFASGRFSRAICDRCGQEYKYQQLKKEWNGLFVCPSCYEPKHPQLEPLRAKADPESLYRPRPNNDHEEGEGFVVVTNNDIFRYNTLNPSTLGSNFVVDGMTSAVGEVTIQTS